MGLYSWTVALGASLLFVVQPMLAKAITPWFGGSAAVWITCLVFFQTGLLAGYAYAHLIVRLFPVRTQTLIHAGVLASSLLLLPVRGWDAATPGAFADPAWQILAFLARGIGLPYLLLSATSPLLQAWYAQSYRGGFVYRLYAFSNVGSLAALVGYPLTVEPLAGVRRQLDLWSGAYTIFALGCGLLAATLWKAAGEGAAASPADSTNASAGRGRPLMWAALATCGSVLLLSVTSHLTQDVAPVPFLWVIPLSLYLASFILCFRAEGWYRPRVWRPAAAIALAGMGWGLLVQAPAANLELIILGYSAGLFICCVFCHGELFRRRPDAGSLTGFYLMVAVGGAVGAGLVALAAPRLFTTFMELRLGLVACALLGLLAGYRQSWMRDAGWMVLTVALAVAAAAEWRRPAQARVSMRNFYGTLLVRDVGEGRDAMRLLTHGAVHHGAQFLAVERRLEPTTYFGPQSGIGLAIRSQRRPGMRMGVIGLGAGTLASYGEPGDYIRFYEINPQVERLAREQFSFLRESKARVETAIGDGRLLLEREPDQRFDLLVVDAFSSDAIPAHLLTREAFQTYQRHLAPEGVLALHITNNYVDLRPVTARLAESVAKAAFWIESKGDLRRGTFSASWVLVGGKEQMERRWGERLEGRIGPLWTDQYSNLVSVLK